MMTRILICTLLCGLLATPALAGPPWISIEYPANPHHPSTRGAALLVRAYHHSTSIAVPVRGTLEGIVDGKRRSVPLDVRATNLTGVYAVRSALPTDGTWVLAIQLTEGQKAHAGALVTLDARGRIAHVEVPNNRTRDGWTVPRALTARDIDDALRSARIANAETNARAPGTALAGLLLVPLLLGAGQLRRRLGQARVA